MQYDGAGRIPERLRLWSLSEDVLVETGHAGDTLVAVTRWGEIWIEDGSPAVREALNRMSFGPVAVVNLPQDEDGPGAPGSGSRLEQVLGRLGCCVVQSLRLDDETGPVLSVAPTSPHATFWAPPRLDPGTPVRLSRYVTVRAGRGELLVESPLSRYRAVLHRPLAAWVVGSLALPSTATEVAALLRTAPEVIVDVLAYLVAAGVVLTAEPGTPPRFAEDTDPRLAAWTPHELAFHASTRLGRYEPVPLPDPAGPDPARPGPAGPDPAGPDPARNGAAPPAGPRFPLRRPRPLAPQTAVGRAAAAGHRGRRPLDADQLGELLFRLAGRSAARAAGGRLAGRVPEPDRAGPGPELTLYVTLDRCAGLPRGTFRYDPARHELVLVTSADADVTALLDMAAVTVDSMLRPPVLITVTTRLGELAGRDDGTAYSATLRHVGALQRTLDLAALGMGLGSAALALSYGSIADDALRLDYPTEVSIAEMTVGSAR